MQPLRNNWYRCVIIDMQCSHKIKSHLLDLSLLYIHLVHSKKVVFHTIIFHLFLIFFLYIPDMSSCVWVWLVVVEKVNLLCWGV
jgi:hypothetical protein